MKENVLKTIVSAAIASAAAYFRVLAVPLLVLIFAMSADYITGMINAGLRGEISSKKGLAGIVKKLCYMFGVGVGIIVDYICNSALSTVGIVGVGGAGANVYFFGILVTVWLILNEATSIVENLHDIGVPMPVFLGAVIEKLKKSAEQNGRENNNNGSKTK